MEMCDCGHNIYGQHKPFHITINSEDDSIMVTSKETQPGPIDMNSVFIDEFYFGGVERFVNKDIFNLQVFYNFCSLCENVVLRERVILSYDIFDSDFANQLRNEGVLAKTLWPQKATKILFDKTKVSLEALEGGELDFHILMKLGLSKMMGISYTPPAQESGRTEHVINELNEHMFNSRLMEAYSQLSKTLERDIKYLKDQGRKINLFIPPITAILLNKISRPSEIAEELLIMRNKFSKTRNTFKEYMEKIQDDSLTLEESLNAKNNIERQLEEITRPYEKRDITTITHWKELIDIIPERLREIRLEELSVKDILKRMVGLPLELIINKIKMKDTVYLARLKKEFLQIPDYNNLVKKVFGKNLSS